MNQHDTLARLHYASEMFFDNCTFSDTTELYTVLTDRADKGETTGLILTHTEEEAAKLSNPSEGVYAL